MKFLTYKWIICLLVILSLSKDRPCYAQTTTVIANLHDTLKPHIINLKDVPVPKIRPAGKPKTITFKPNIAQGKSNFTTYTSDDGLAMDAINWGKTTVCDSEGNIWFATQGGGVSKYDGKSFINFTVEQGLANNSVRSICEDKSGNLWFGTSGGGVSKYDGKSFINFTVEQGLANNYVFSICEDKSGNLWFGTYGGGVSKYDGKSFINFTVEQGLANNSVISICEDKSGNLWFGTYGGVSKYDGKSFINFTVEQGLANNSVFSICEDKSGNLWFGTSGGGVSKYDGKSFVTYTTEQGLSDNVIVGIKETKDGKMILGTNFGLSVLTLINGPKPSIEIYNQFTGYPVRDVNGGGNNNGAMCYDSNGVLWVGHGSNGVTRVDLDAVNKSSAPPKVVINKVRLKGENICWYNLRVASLRSKKQSAPNNEIASLSLAMTDSATLAQQEIMTYGRLLKQEERDTLQMRFKGVEFDDITKFYPLPENLVLPYEHNALTFEFIAIETGRNFLVNYQYMLKGMDDTWSPITKKADATYNNLHEGEYTFLLKAQSPWGVWSEPTEFHFTVLPPWYRTIWAYGIYLVLFILMLIGLIHLQTRRLKQRQKELEMEVDKATIEIRSQKEKIEEAHKEITDSINYAERIQRSFLASKELLDENLNEYFIFFQPKDVVSGDFYWAGTLQNKHFALVNADSTGHGVPGAIMSLLNITSIEKAIETETSPDKILNTTRNIIIERLKKDGSAEGGKDGMDCSLLSFNTDKTELTFAAANNPVWIVRGNELIEFKADRMPVGKGENDKTSFNVNTTKLEKGDAVYTITDGFQDQFGGPKGKKFMVKKLKELLVSIAHLPMQEQHAQLKTTFNNWKADEQQVDDVCIIGVRI